jgi:hypothetical protein
MQKMQLPCQRLTKKTKGTGTSEKDGLGVEERGPQGDIRSGTAQVSAGISPVAGMTPVRMQCSEIRHV